MPDRLRANPEIDPLFRKQFSQNIKNLLLLDRVDFADLFDESSFVDCSNLIENDLSFFSIELTGHPRRVVISFRGHWSHDNRCNMVVHLIR
jgi:hypothetical protein